MGPEILIVGDRSHRGALIPRVQDLGYTVTPVRERELSGRVAASPAPAAVLICLGETDAAALVAAARRGRDDVPVVIFGPLGGALRDLADVLELGADHFLAAPVGDAELARVLAELAGPGAPDDDPLWQSSDDEDDPVRPLTGSTNGGLGQLHRTLEILAARVQSHAGESEPDALELDSLGLDAVPDVDRELDPPDAEALLTDPESSDPAAPRRPEATQRLAPPRVTRPAPLPGPEDSRGAMQGEDTMRLRAPTRAVAPARGAVRGDRFGGDRSGAVREDRSGGTGAVRGDRSGRVGEDIGAVREDRSRRAGERTGAVREDRSGEPAEAVREDRSAERRSRPGPGDTTARVLARRPDEARGARGAGDTTARLTAPRDDARARESGDSTARLTAPRDDASSRESRGASTRLTAPRDDARSADSTARSAEPHSRGAGDSTARLTAPRDDARVRESGSSTARVTASPEDMRDLPDDQTLPGAPRNVFREPRGEQARPREQLGRGDATRARMWGDDAKATASPTAASATRVEGRGARPTLGGSRDEFRGAVPGGSRDEGLRDDATEPSDGRRDTGETTGRSRLSLPRSRRDDPPRPDVTEPVARHSAQGDRLAGAEILDRLWQLHARRMQGRLTVGFAGGAIKRVWWRRGEPVHATSTAAADGLLARLQARGLLARAQLGAAAREVDEQLGESARRLVRAGLLKPREQHDAVRDVIARIVESLCSDAAERWQFDAEAPPTEVALGVPVLALLAAGARLGLGRDRLRAQLPEDVALRLEVDDVAALADELRWPGADAWLGLLDGSRSLALLVAEDGLEERELWAAGCVLLAAGLAVRAEPDADAALLAIDRQRIDERLALARDSDYFTLLGLGRDAGRAEVLRAYEDLRGTFADERLEPRTREVLADALTELHAALDEAREVLLDEALRTAYLAHLDALPPGE